MLTTFWNRWKRVTWEHFWSMVGFLLLTEHSEDMNAHEEIQKSTPVIQNLQDYMILYSFLASEMSWHTWKLWREQYSCVPDQSALKASYLFYKRRIRPTFQEGMKTTKHQYFSLKEKQPTCNEIHSSSVSVFLEERILRLFQSKKSLWYMQLYTSAS